jgi:hypothetical protein
MVAREQNPSLGGLPRPPRDMVPITETRRNVLKKKEDLSPIGEFLFEHSRTNNYIDAATEIGISPTHFSEIVNGNRSPPLKCARESQKFSILQN